MSLCLEDRLILAHQALGRSVVDVNPRALAESKTKRPHFNCMGVKDTSDIPDALLNRLLSSPNWLVLTIDRMSDLGRSIDCELVNPLTYRPMTGSTSGGAINVLKGINDICLGTDGGGSVLAPALATNLYAFLGKGVGLACDLASCSTDGLSFAGGVGFIARTFELCITAAQDAGAIDLDGGNLPSKVIVPARGCAKLPSGQDMREHLEPYLEYLAIEIEEHAFTDIYDRRSSVFDLSYMWEKDPCTCVLTFEGPVDVLGADETIPREFAGIAPRIVAGTPSKALSKAVNIAGGTAMCVPSDELACGLLVACGPGLEAARDMLCLARKLSEHTKLPSCLVRYFHDRKKAPHPIELFSNR